jgi:hypothetical protein
MSNGGTSQYEQQSRLNVLRGTAYIAPANWYLALFTTLPNAAGAGGVESADTAYARLQIPANTSNWTAASGGGPASASNVLAQTMFAANGDDANPVVGWGLYDALTSGHLVFWAPVSSPAALVAGNVPLFGVGALLLQAE